MESADILQTFAEIAIALAGFGGIAAGLGYRSRGAWRDDDQTRLIGMAYTSLLVVFAALLPFVIYNLGMASPWRISASLVLPLQLVIVFGSFRVFRHGIPQTHSRVASILLMLAHLGTVGVLSAISFNIYASSQFGLYLLGVVLMLFVAALLFVRLLSTSFQDGADAS